MFKHIITVSLILMTFNVFATGHYLDSSQTNSITLTVAKGQAYKVFFTNVKLNALSTIKVYIKFGAIEYLALNTNQLSQPEYGENVLGKFTSFNVIFVGNTENCISINPREDEEVLVEIIVPEDKTEKNCKDRSN